MQFTYKYNNKNEIISMLLKTHYITSINSVSYKALKAESQRETDKP